MKKQMLPLSLLLLVFTSCLDQRQSEIFPKESHLPGLASPFKLQGPQSVLLLADYFLDPAIVDSVNGNEAFTFHHNKEAGEVLITAKNDDIPQYSELKIWVTGYKYSILVEKSKKVKFVYSFDPKNKAYRSVHLFGQMNNWNRSATPMVFRDGLWQTELELNPGRYQYLLMLDGKESLDLNNPDITDNNIGGFNSVLNVGNSDSLNVPRLFTSSTELDQIRVGFENDPEKIFVFWQNHRLPVEFIIRQSNKLVITIPKAAENTDRSFIRIWSYNKEGASNDLLIPLHKRQVLDSLSMLTRDDAEASILYFLMIDRFNNGNQENDEPIDDPEVNSKTNYWGGDLAGITKKIRDGYFANLGINSIWLSPITQNPLQAYVEYPEPKRKYSGYHGYWPITLTTVDHRFGTSAEMHELVKEAHANGINVLLDFVSNHVHEENKLIKENPAWATELTLPDGQKNIRLWDDQRLTTWFDTFLPTLDLSNPEVAELLADSALYWIKEYKLDGFRHDATKHIPEQYWRTLTRKLKEEVMLPQNKRLYQIGETFGGRELIGSYVGSGLLDGQFDFNLYFDARSVFALDNESFIRMNNSLMETFDYYGSNHLMGNITGNHDLPRFISFAGGSLSFDEDGVEAGWSRDIKVGNPNAYAKLSMLTAFTMTIPGVPVIYYGDEIGIPGGGDPDSRRPMRFENLAPKEIETKEIAAKLTKLRQNRLSLIYGDLYVLHLSNDTWVYSRRYFDEITIVAFNKGNQPATISFELPEIFNETILKDNFGNKADKNENHVTVTIQPYSFEILVN
ncbi:MAG: alpha-glucosidase C-terminal domain-containing protein [Bacteroidales bacterium]|nr:alpha-glucosidase C-terminal domain-containing protein [Bacteroidales bacterium]